MIKIVRLVIFRTLVPAQQTDTLSEVTIDADEDELILEDHCYVKV